MKKQMLAFTLVEILVVIAIISVLAAILFPVFNTARKKGYQTACVSNLHQIGAGILLYAQDYDELLPWGTDPSDFGIISSKGVEYSAPSMKSILTPYLKSEDIWRCPADFGLKGYLGNMPTSHVSSYKLHGTSYYHWTPLIGAKHPLSTFSGEMKATVNGEKTVISINTSNLPFIGDGELKWHVGEKINFWFLDGHVASVNHSYSSRIYWGYAIFQNE